MAMPQMRRPRVDGTHNFRDIGGYLAREGVLRWGVLYRSDALHELTERGRAQLDALGVSRVVDLRKHSEREALPAAVAGGVEVSAIPIYESLGQLNVDLWPTFDLSLYYQGLVRHRGQQLASAVAEIASSTGPTLVNCTAGKDRTGLVVALVMTLAGVSRNDVAADYAISESLLSGEWAFRMAERFRRQQDLPDTVDPAGIVSGSPASAMLGVLALIDEEFGSARSYLQANGLAKDDVDRVVALLVEPTDEVVFA